jgi:5-methylcytosine-specific restriction enzyme subunit McrC
LYSTLRCEPAAAKRICISVSVCICKESERSKMAATITLFEHEAQAFDWVDRDLAALERLRNAVGAEILRPTVQNGQRVLKAAQHVGVIRLGSRTIQILPKIYHPGAIADEKQNAREATHNLLYMLAYAEQLQIREHSLAGLLRRDGDWFELLTRLFAVHLQDEWQRGAYRNYQTIEAESTILKGKWRIADQMRRPERKHIFAIAHDQFSADNPLNRVFRFVVERLWNLTRDAENRHLLGDLRQWMDEVTLVSGIKAHDTNPALLTRLNQRYAPLLNLARLFIDGSALQLAAGNVTTFAFVFDMNQLFEAFAVNFIRRHRDAILPADLRSCELLPQSRGAACYLAKRDGANVFQLLPDLVLREANRFPLLIDLKYKRLDATARTSGVAQADFYQMHAYAHRYDCPQVLLLYPQTAEMAEAHHTNCDDFRKYLEAVPHKYLSESLQQLFDGGEAGGPQFAQCIDRFKQEIDSTYYKILPRNRRISLGLISILLASRFPHRYIFYRASLIDSVCELWGIQRPKGDTLGMTYLAYLDFIQPIQLRLSAALDRNADLIDTHTLLYLNHNHEHGRSLHRASRPRPASPVQLC